MANLDRIRVGLIGYGIGKVHVLALRNVNMYYEDLPPVELVAVATASEASGRQAIERFGFQRHTTNYHDLLASDDINTLVVAAPNYLHHEMLLAALQTDKAIYADKPLANTLAEARAIVAAARQHGHDAQMAFSLRYNPALRTARQLIQDGRLGAIYAFRARYFRSSYSDPEKPLRWKASMAQSGGGVLNDLVPHIADLVHWLIGVPSRLTAQVRTFIKERPVAKGKPEKVSIETDDHVIIQAELPGGAIGTIESGRLITGSVNDITLEIFGSEGSIRWNQMDTNYLYFAERAAHAASPPLNGPAGWLQIPTVQDYPDALLPGADVPLGATRFYIASLADFLRNTCQGRPYDPGLLQGLHAQAITEAALQAAHDHTWVDVAQA